MAESNSLCHFGLLHSLGRPYVCLRQFRFAIGQFGCSGLPSSDAKGKPAIENEPRKNISTWNNFFLILVQIVRNFQIVMIRLLCYESES